MSPTPKASWCSTPAAKRWARTTRKWNDVYLTLRGEYGARSTRSEPDDATSSVMHVGAPIRDNGQIIGVVTVAKPNSSLQPYVDRTERRLLWYGAGLVVLGLLLGALLSWWLSVALRRLTAYAEAVSEGRRAEVAALPWRRAEAIVHRRGAHAHATGGQGLRRALRAHPDP